MSSSVSRHDLFVAGLPVQVYTNGDLSSIKGEVAVLFLLHGRTEFAEKYKSTAERILTRITEHEAEGKQEKQLVVVTFDQRNHGHRLTHKLTNGVWIEGNERHAIDMYAVYVGTAKDVSFLIDFLPAHIFPSDEAKVVQWLVAGVSLGGHATWWSLRHEPRVTLGVPIIGCPNYTNLIKDRAQTSGVDFAPPIAPQTFIDLLKATDAAQVPYTASDSSNPFLGKKILVLSGKEDRLVPWTSSEEVVSNLNVGEQGVKKVFVYPGVGHECTAEMIKEAADFVWEYALTAAA
ncbi:alpha/beta-hydrolase [Trametopsis cervina]|nr:alpha/beta-hydrolase [Trametopsis cervina]